MITDISELIIWTLIAITFILPITCNTDNYITNNMDTIVFIFYFLTIASMITIVITTN